MVAETEEVLARTEAFGPDAKPVVDIRVLTKSLIIASSFVHYTTIHHVTQSVSIIQLPDLAFCENPAYPTNVIAFQDRKAVIYSRQTMGL